MSSIEKPFKRKALTNDLLRKAFTNNQRLKTMGSVDIKWLLIECKLNDIKDFMDLYQTLENTLFSESVQQLNDIFAKIHFRRQSRTQMATKVVTNSQILIDYMTNDLSHLNRLLKGLPQQHPKRDLCEDIIALISDFEFKYDPFFRVSVKYNEVMDVLDAIELNPDFQDKEEFNSMKKSLVFDIKRIQWFIPSTDGEREFVVFQLHQLLFELQSYLLSVPSDHQKRAISDDILECVQQIQAMDVFHQKLDSSGCLHSGVDEGIEGLG